MCPTAEFFASLAVVGLLACMALGLVHESRFIGYMENHHTAVRNELGERSRWLMPEDKNYSAAGVQWYLILWGGYKKIDDAQAQKLGRNARIVSMTAIACLIVVGTFPTATQTFPSLRCLWSSL